MFANTFFPLGCLLAFAWEGGSALLEAERTLKSLLKQLAQLQPLKAAVRTRQLLLKSILLFWACFRQCKFIADADLSPRG